MQVAHAQVGADRRGGARRVIGLGGVGRVVLEDFGAGVGRHHQLELPGCRRSRRPGEGEGAVAETSGADGPVHRGVVAQGCADGDLARGEVAHQHRVGPGPGDRGVARVVDAPVQGNRRTRLGSGGLQAQVAHLEVRVGGELERDRHRSAVVQLGGSGGVALDDGVADIRLHLEREIARAGVAVGDRDRDLARARAARLKRHRADVVVVDQEVADRRVVARDVADQQPVQPGARGRQVAGIEDLVADHDLRARYEPASGRDDRQVAHDQVGSGLGAQAGEDDLGGGRYRLGVERVARDRGCVDASFDQQGVAAAEGQRQQSHVAGAQAGQAEYGVRERIEQPPGRRRACSQAQKIEIEAIARCGSERIQICLVRRVELAIDRCTRRDRGRLCEVEYPETVGGCLIVGRVHR